MGFFDNDKDDNERFWNMIVYHTPMTNKEMEDSAPIMVGVLAAVVAIVLIIWAVS